MAQSSVASAKPRHGIKEFIRKFFVGLKRNPQNISMLMMLITFIIYSFNLTAISDTTAKVGLPNMGQCEFVSMLLGILSFVSFLRAFPRREKPNLIMIGLTILMLGVCVVMDIVYNLRITQGLTREVGPVVITEETAYITKAQGIMSLHMILLIVCIVLIVLLPVYSKLIRKINTSIEVEGNENIGSIDISSED